MNNPSEERVIVAEHELSGDSIGAWLTNRAAALVAEGMHPNDAHLAAAAELTQANPKPTTPDAGPPPVIQAAAKPNVGTQIQRIEPNPAQPVAATPGQALPSLDYTGKTDSEYTDAVTALANAGNVFVRPGANFTQLWMGPASGTPGGQFKVALPHPRTSGNNLVDRSVQAFPIGTPETKAGVSETIGAAGLIGGAWYFGEKVWRGAKAMFGSSEG